MNTGLGEIVLYQTDAGGPALDVRLERESIWLTQAQMAELFGVNVPAIFKHIKNIYATGELESGATVSKMEIVRQEGSFGEIYKRSPSQYAHTPGGGWRHESWLCRIQSSTSLPKSPYERVPCSNP